MIYTLPNSNNKARVFKDSNGDEFLISYDTAVLVKHGDKLYRLERNDRTPYSSILRIKQMNRIRF